jgi:DNA-binding PadR family transcriptional regulator
VSQGEATELLPLSPPVYHVLLALGKSAKHGYAIMQTFEEMTGGTEQLLPGTLYATLARMVETGLLEETDPPGPDTGRRRRYYRVTPRGHRVAALEGDRLSRLLELARVQGMAPGRAEP